MAFSSDPTRSAVAETIPAASVDDYLALITSAHRTQPKFSATVAAVVQPFVDLQNFVNSLQTAFDLDTAAGAQLDTIGLWVGRSRNLTLPISGVYFAFDTAGLGFDQGVWKGPFDPTDGVTHLDDETYRLVLRAKIAMNSWDGTIPGAQAALQFLFGLVPESHLFIEDHQDMSMVVAVSGKSPSAIFAALLRDGAVPIKPEGVRVDYRVSSVDGSPLFGFDVNNQYVGGFDVGSWGVPPGSTIAGSSGSLLDSFVLDTDALA